MTEEKKVVILSINVSPFDLEGVIHGLQNLGHSIGVEFIITNATDIKPIPLSELKTFIGNLENVEN